MMPPQLIAAGLLVLGLACLFIATHIEQSGMFSASDFLGLIGLPAIGIMLCGIGALWLALLYFGWL